MTNKCIGHAARRDRRGIINFHCGGISCLPSCKQALQRNPALCLLTMEQLGSQSTGRGEQTRASCAFTGYRHGVPRRRQPGRMLPPASFITIRRAARCHSRDHQRRRARFDLWKTPRRPLELSCMNLDSVTGKLTVTRLHQIGSSCRVVIAAYRRAAR